ncbi:MAG: pirin family protein [Acidobacteriota bacterium]
MIQLRPSEERGHADHGWLQARHSFSFGQYHDPRHLGFRSLRVLNEDRIAPEAGFPPHPHRDMEILTHVLAGRLEHRDSMGHGSVIEAGEFQRMSAGTGVTHSELNASDSDPVHMLQIWIRPDEAGLTPSYEQGRFDDRRGRFRVVASPDGREGSLTIRQDAVVASALLDAGASLRHELAPDRHAWLQVVTGDARLDEHELSAGDGAAISDVSTLDITTRAGAELLLFDLA